MGSNSVASFLAKLLRQDKKEKQKQPVDNKRRHSAPVPDWYEITEAGQVTANAQKLPEKQRKQNVKYASQQNLAGSKKQKQARSKQASNNSKRQSAGFPSWFCVSGNTETLDRSMMPLPDHGNNKDNMSNNKKITVNNDKPKVDFIRLKDGKNGRAKENRYSAPPVEWASKKATSSNGQGETNGKVSKPAVKQVRRELSPGVKYRTDGTLEKPYVFPAGLTFGPEGRKLQLRRTAHSCISEESLHLLRPNEKSVKADVHRSSTEDIIMEYSYEDINPHLGEFDVRKAFYLKYDSDFSETKTHESSVDGDNYKQEAFTFNTDYSYIYRRNTNGLENCTNSPQTKATVVGAVNRIAQQKNSNRQEMCRYSMPPQNEDLVYMGSFENVNISDYALNENDVPKPGLNIGDSTRRSSRSTARSSRINRYSMPVRNSDLVYMGSFENVNQLLNGNTNAGTGFSLYSETNDTDERSLHSGGERCKTASEVQVDQPVHFTAAEDEKHGSVISGYIYHRRCGSSGGTPAIAPPAVSEAKQTTSSSSFKNVSMPDMQFAKNFSISKSNSEKDASSTSGDEGRDVFDASSLSCDTTDKTPFFTRRGRSSCMPGNSRFIAPPPAVTAPFISTKSSNSNSVRSPSFMPGSKRFSLPPPPNYTPPKEEMVFTHAHLKEMNCHKGSQTDLSIEFENLTMEDRDASLHREDVKTIYAGAATHISEATIRDLTDRVKSNRFVLQDREPKSKCVELQGQMLDVSDLSHGSDEVFHDTKSSVGEDNERSKTRRFTKFRSKISSNLEQNKLPISSSLSYSKEVDQKRLSRESKMTNRITQSDFSCEHLSSASNTNCISTPSRSARPQSQWSCESNIATPHSKPIPTPRKISHTDSLNKKSDISVADTQQALTCNSVQPVPKQRHSLTYSRSISPLNTYETMSSPNGSQEGHRINRQQLLRTQSCDQTSTLQRKQNKGRSQALQSVASQNIYVSIDDENVYEEIDSQVNVSELNNSKYENIYEECGEIDSEKRAHSFEKNKKQNNIGKNEKQRLETSLSPLQTITLSASPGQRRRNVNTPKEPATHAIPLSQPQHNCGLPTSLVQPDAVCANMRQEKGGIIELVDINKKFQYNDSDDNSSIADDEMSLSNEEDMEEIAKRYSLRRCVSADNLLRSGSIIDRSMILAKRRRKRMRERRSKSQLQLFTDAKYDFTNASFKVHYTKRKRTSNERLFKQKPSHTDSGHDSEIVSPCTSPDTRRHVDNMTSLNHAGGSNDINTSWVPRNGTLPRKSWEIRMKNTQNLRKCKSRESLLIPSEKMYQSSNSAFETGY